MKRNFLKMYFLMFLIILLNACSNVETIQHIEVYVVETPQQGFKKVNAITTIEGKNYMKADTKAIEDFYDIEGNYIKTEIVHSTGNKSNVNLVEDVENRKVELQEPSTILIPDGNKNFKLDNMTKVENEKVKEHILSFMDFL